MHRSAILAILLIQISRCLQIEKNCDTALQFQEQERKSHHYRYHWTLRRLPCEPCTYESKQNGSAYKFNRIFQFCS